VALMESSKLHIVDLNALEALFREHYHFLCTSAYYVTGDEEAARDVVQEFFYYCWKKRDELVVVNSFKNYAFRAVKNGSLNYLKYEKRNMPDPDLLFEGMMTDDFADREGWQLEEERNKALWAAIDNLPQQRRLIFLLSNKNELTYAQIADQLDISVNTVKTQIRLAYQYLRRECRWLILLMVLLFFSKK
jgi:RNA polymerase sigma-70 factor (family 1)